MSVTIRPMARADVPRVALLEREVYPQAWSARIFHDELSRQDRVYLLAEDDDGELLGYAGLLLVATDAHVTTLAVAPEARRRRLGTRLLLALVDEALARGARHLTLEVRVSNVNAQRLYERFGFSPVGRRKDYYPEEDALVMWATDIDSPEYARLLEEIRDSLLEDDP